jgi:hypothetical protein
MVYIKEGYIRMITEFFFPGATPLSGPGPPHYWIFKITLRNNILGMTSLYEISARIRDFYRLYMTFTIERHPRLRQDLNAQFQEAGGSRPAP